MNRRCGRLGALLALGGVFIAPACGSATGTAPPAHPRNASNALAVPSTTSTSTAPGGTWTSPSVVITPTSLGAVTLGMSSAQAEQGAGTALVVYGDGFSGPADGLHGTPPGTTTLETLSSAAGGSNVSCLTARCRRHDSCRHHSGGSGPR